MNYDIVEKFFTVNGEAPCPGRPVFLVRFSGCNLDCSYCDTPYRHEVNYSLTQAQLVSEIELAMREYPAADILFTGGEPLLGKRQHALESIFAKFPERTFFIETNGSVRITGFSFGNTRYVVDWKTPSSGSPDTFCMENLPQLRSGADCIKIVAGRDDLAGVPAILAMIRAANPKLEVFLSPQWGNVAFDEMAEFIVNNRLDLSLSLQLHKVIWGTIRGV